MQELFDLAAAARAAMPGDGRALFAVAEEAIRQLGGPEAVLRQVDRVCRALTPGVYRYGGEGTGMYPTVYEVVGGWVYAHTLHSGTCSPGSPCEKEVPAEQAYRLVWPLDVIVQAARDMLRSAMGKEE
jgi:hypothetical protein